MSEKSIVQEARDIQLAMELITLGARLQMLESETQLSRGRLIKLYKELRGSPPPKGMLPFSTDWFMTWEQNVGNDSNLLIVFYIQIMPDDFVMQLHRF
ncbi:flagellar transcriptional activator flhC [Escherichia coli UMEA 3190-1]|nr:flagellar transcriptional activator flhC [Escherichia coli UMEA 3190-1]